MVIIDPSRSAILADFDNITTAFLASPKTMPVGPNQLIDN
jgi:hypothetical protein